MGGKPVWQLAMIGLGMLCQWADSCLAAEQPVQASRHAVIMAGPAVGATNVQRFRQWALSLHDILGQEYGYSADTITLLHDRGDDGFAGGDRVDGATDRAGIARALQALSQRMQPGDQLLLYLIGHGSGAGQQARFNIVGPDLTGIEFAAMLEPFAQQELIIINTTSAGFDFAAALCGPGRIVISATRSAAERYDPVFAGYFIEALDQGKGDRDKNNRVSVLEAFDYARANVQQWYAEQGRLVTEHAVLDDNGDGLFSLTPAVDQVDGLLAQLAYFDHPQDRHRGISAPARQLLTRMQELERAVFQLRGRKADYLLADYWQRMEPLLIELAVVTGQFDEQLD